jgi:hypothetical protein
LRVNLYWPGGFSAAWRKSGAFNDAGSQGGRAMPLYRYVLHGGAATPAEARYDLDDDDGAIALSICVLRDQPHHGQVWVLDEDGPVAVRIRADGHQTGLLLKMR